MATQIELTAALEALKKARRSGLRRVRYGDREMEYKSDADMRAAISDLEEELTQAAGLPGRRRSFFSSTRKGL
jgi:hypothetical protein